MLVAITQNNERVFAYDYDIARLKRLSERNLLRCPDCGNIVKVRMGKKIGTYFCHIRNCKCTSQNSNPKTEENAVKKEKPKEFQQSKVCPICNKSYLIQYVKSRGYIAKCGCQKETPINPPICPTCGAKMFLRKNTSNNKVFWGCSKYPVCRGTREFDVK